MYPHLQLANQQSTSTDIKSPVMAGFMTNFGHSKYSIVLFCSGSAVYQACLVSP